MEMQRAPSTLRRKFERLRYLYQHGGAGGVVFYLLYKLANRITRLLVLRMAVIEPPAIEPHLGQLDAYRHGLVSPQDLLPYVDDPETDLTREFLDYAANQGDSCYAIFEGDTLASYCWNSDKPTRIDRDLYMDFRPTFIYRYKEFTRPSHRGRRLGSFNHAESLRHFATWGVQGFAGYVEVNNFVQHSMLKRMNHLFPGFIVILGRGPNPWIWHSPKARKWGFNVASTTPGVYPQKALR